MSYRSPSFDKQLPKFCKIKSDAIQFAGKTSEWAGLSFGYNHDVSIFNRTMGNKNYVCHRTGGQYKSSFENVTGNELCGGNKYDQATGVYYFDILNICTFKIASST